MNITLNYTALKKDADQWTYRLGKQIQDIETRDEAQSDSLDFSTTWWRRHFADGAAMLKKIMSERVTLTTTDANSDINTTNTSWTFAVTAPNADSKALADLMHSFVLTFALKAWIEAYAPNGGETVSKDYNDAKDAIEYFIYKTVRPTKSTSDAN